MILSDIIGAAVSGANTFQTNQANLSMNQANIDYQKELNNQIFQREDTAYQRTMSDLTKAGLSASMAFGGTNGAGGSVSAPANSFAMQTSQVGQILAQSDSILDTIAKGVEIQNGKKSLELLQSQIDKNNAETQNLDPWNKYSLMLEHFANSLDPNSADYSNIMKVSNYVKHFIMDNNLFSKLGYSDKVNDFLNDPETFINNLYESGKSKSKEVFENGKNAVIETVKDVTSDVGSGIKSILGIPEGSSSSEPPSLGSYQVKDNLIDKYIYNKKLDKSAKRFEKDMKKKAKAAAKAKRKSDRERFVREYQESLNY